MQKAVYPYHLCFASTNEFSWIEKATGRVKCIVNLKNTVLLPILAYDLNLRELIRSFAYHFLGPPQS